jgi:multiple sugar transport system permease protein
MTAGKTRPVKKNWLIAFCFMLPFLVLYSVFTIWPVIFGVDVSFHKWSLMGEQGFLGGKNYLKLLKDRFFWESILHTLIFVGLATPFLVMIPFFLAVLANRPVPLKKFFRISYYIPNILSVSVISYITVYLASPYMGLFNQILHMLRLIPADVEPMWLSNPKLVWTTIVSATVWWTAGFPFLLYLSALQDIPEQLYEAARIDGAGSGRMLFSITMPIVKSTFLLVAFLEIIASFKVFGQIYLITGGGPGTVTRPIIQYIYTTAFQKNNLGYASAMSYILFLLLIVFTVGQMKFQNRKGLYD